jgi:hypothetical protein
MQYLQVDDDVALANNENKSVGARGLCGTILIEKSKLIFTTYKGDVKMKLNT